MYQPVSPFSYPPIPSPFLSKSLPTNSPSISLHKGTGLPWLAQGEARPKSSPYR